jgi:hypothetical protein
MSQPPPTPGKVDVVDALVNDIYTRAEKGLDTYGTYLKTDNGRDALQDALEEALDLAVYLKQEQLERASLERHVELLETRLAIRNRTRKTHFAKSRRQRHAYASLQKYVARLRAKLYSAEIDARCAREREQRQRDASAAKVGVAANLAGAFADYFHFLNRTDALTGLTPEQKTESRPMLQKLLELAINAGATL